MSCPGELILMTYADGELADAERAAVDAHLADCAACRERLAALRAEGAAMIAALGADVPVAVPTFAPPVSRPAVAAGAGALVLVATLIAAVPDVVDLSLPEPFTWFETFDVVSLADLAIQGGLFLVERGGAIMTGILELAALATVLGFVVWIAVALRRRRSGPMLLTMLAGTLLTLPTPVEALDLRRAQNGSVVVAAGETIDDTLIAMGETVEVNGDVTGDVIAAGRRVVIRGRVGGQVIAAAENITLDGEVANGVIAAARTVTVSAPRIGGNLIGFGATIDASPRTRMEENVVVFAERVHLTGQVTRDVLAMVESFELGGKIGGSLTAYGNRITLLAPAEVTGNVLAHVPEQDHLNVSPGATVGGEVQTDVSPEHVDDDGEYTSAGYYLAQLLRFAAAFLVGLLLLALAPRLRRASLNSAGEALVAGGVGLVTLVAVPIVAIIIAITIIGIPIAVLAVLVWVVAIYLAKIVLAHFLGARLLEAATNPRHFAVALVVGLLLIMIAVNLPFIGGVLNFLLTICGLGLLVLFAWHGLRREPRAAEV